MKYIIAKQFVVKNSLVKSNLRDTNLKRTRKATYFPQKLLAHVNAKRHMHNKVLQLTPRTSPNLSFKAKIMGSIKPNVFLT